MEGGWIWTQGAAAQHANPRASEWGRTDGRFGSNRERQSNSYSNGENPSEESSEDALITHRRQRGEPAEARTGRSPSALRSTRPRRRAEDPAADGKVEGGGLPSRPPSLWARYHTRSAGRGGAWQRSAMAGGRRSRGSGGEWLVRSGGRPPVHHRPVGVQGGLVVLSLSSRV